MSQLDSIHVIGCDPGKTTGLARWFHGRIESTAVLFADVEPTITTWLADTAPAVIAIERFVITRNTARKTQQTDALKLSGVIENIAVRDGRHVIVYQNMSDAKKIGSPTLLRALGWRKTGRNATHMNDAMSQVVKVLASRFPVAFAELVTPDIV